MLWESRASRARQTVGARVGFQVTIQKAFRMLTRTSWPIQLPVTLLSRVLLLIILSFVNQPSAFGLTLLHQLLDTFG